MKYNIKSNVILFLKRLIVLILKCPVKSYIKKLINLKEDEVCIISPYGIGDLYINLLFIDEISKRTNKKIVIASKGFSKDISKIFEGKISRNIIINKKIIRYITIYEYIVNKKLFNDSKYILDSRIEDNMSIIKNKGTLLELIKYNLCIPDKIIANEPCLNSEGYLHNIIRENIDNIFKESELIEGNTIILFPDANSIKLLNSSFWLELAEKLEEKGYSICFNTNNNDYKKYKCIQLSLYETLYFAHKSGFLIALRSGICDLMSSLAIKKVILYPNDVSERKEKGFSNYYAYSFEKMNIGKNYIELNLDNNDNDIKAILEYF